MSHYRPKRRTVFTVPTNARQSPCRSCKQPVVWWENPRTGRKMPLDVGSAEPTLDAAFVQMVSHFATCPQAEQWRRGKENQ